MLLNKIATIFENTITKDIYGSAVAVWNIKYTDVATRLVDVDSTESIANGMEQDEPSTHRIYIKKQYTVTESNKVSIDDEIFDIVAVDNSFKRFWQIDVKLSRVTGDIRGNGIYRMLEGRPWNNVILRTTEDGYIRQLEG